jgi:hypothetical protein
VRVRVRVRVRVPDEDGGIDPRKVLAHLEGDVEPPALRLTHAHAHAHAHAAGSEVVAPRACSARILHAGTSTALLQIVDAAEELPEARGPYDTLRLIDE